MTQVTDDPETEIRRLVDEWVEALRSRNVDQRTAAYAPNVLLFDVVDPLQHVGLQALKSRLGAWFSNFGGPIECDVRDLHVTADGDVAFCHYLCGFSGALKEGGQLAMWVRFTTCFAKIDGRWTVTHEHSSVPFNVETGKASIELAP